MILDEEEIEDDDERISLQRRRRRTPIVYQEDVEELFQESELVEMTDSPFWAPVVLTGQKGTASSVAPNFAPPSTSALPPVASNREQDVHSSWSPDHRNLENVFPTSIQDPNGKHSVTITVLNEWHILSKVVGVANYL